MAYAGGKAFSAPLGQALGCCPWRVAAEQAGPLRAVAWGVFWHGTNF